MKPKDKKNKKKSESSRKTELNETKHDSIKEKPYITREIETSITLLESPEGNIVLESLLFLSKYADIQRNNLNFVQSHGLLPKLLALLDHNICILRVSLRLLSQLLTTDAAQLQLNEDRFNEHILKICKFYTSHEDVYVKEFSILILTTYSNMGKTEILLAEPNLIRAILKTVKEPENDIILATTLQLFNKLIEVKEVRAALPNEEYFRLDIFIEKMSASDESFKIILGILEKITYFGDDELQTRLKECNLVEHVFNIIIDPDRKEHVMTCLNIVMHCMKNENTNSYFVQRDSKTLHMIRTYDGIKLLLQYLSFGTDKLSEHSYRKLLEIINMFVTNNQLQSLILSPVLYDVILTQTLSKFDEICIRSLEIMINCLNHQDFQSYFLLNTGSQIIIDKLSNTDKENVIRMLIIFIHNGLMYDNLSNDFIHHKMLLVLKKIPDGIRYRNPLIGTVINLIYDICLPLKFFETGRLELVDKLKEKFYIITGPWSQPFPFLEVLQLRQISTLSTIYVIDDVKMNSELMCNRCYDIQDQHRRSVSESSSVTSITSSLKNSINYGKLSNDPYLPKYINKVHQLLAGVSPIKDKVKILAEFVGDNLCGPNENCTVPDKLHTFKLHIACIKEKLGTNLIPIGYLRIGFHCERALLFKALADQAYIPATLVRGKNKLYWNEIALIQSKGRKTVLKMFVVDLMNNIGQLLPVGSRECNAYCDIE
ncbi:uncharacterized protein BDFB_002774 [Asbolus verrucosus]|uniref:EDR1/CTR1/ARMC3-like peptidase-like domain-containing protein n=1 Tax=Asbolus verrucosus TaxID=1661398 RepID=A0A482W6B8_ASBVE|nr:uncharacterized protein BDFB_002774 [Asbolus verrucosus]